MPGTLPVPQRAAGGGGPYEYTITRRRECIHAFRKMHPQNGSIRSLRARQSMPRTLPVPQRAAGAAAPTNTPSPAVGNAFMHSAKCTRGTDESVPYAHRRPRRRAGCPHPAENTSKNLQPPTMIHRRRGRRPRRPGSACKFASCSRGDVGIAPYSPANQCPELCRCPTGRRGRRPLRTQNIDIEPK